MIEFHHQAIQLLKNGQELGIDGPAADRSLLVDEDGNVASNRIIDNQWGCSWLLNDEFADRCGRRFVPTGERSRIQKQLGLHETSECQPCSRYMNSHCAGIGLPVGFSPKFDD